MEVSKKEELFVELTNAEEANIAGGFSPIQRLVIDQINRAVGQGIDRVRQVINMFQAFFRIPGNGFIFGDRKGTHNDVLRVGDVPMDTPYKTFGLRIGRHWVIGR